MVERVKTRGIMLRQQRSLGTQERLSLLRSVRGMWKNRKPDPIRELAKMKKEWDMPRLSSR